MTTIECRALTPEEAFNLPEAVRSRELFAALKTRVLTAEELAEAGRYGTELNQPFHEAYNAAEKLTELHIAWQIQTNLRVAAQDIK